MIQSACEIALEFFYVAHNNLEAFPGSVYKFSRFDKILNFEHFCALLQIMSLEIVRGKIPEKEDSKQKLVISSV